MPLICLDCRYVHTRPSGIGAIVRALVDYLPDLAPDMNFLLLRNPAMNRPLSAAANVREVVIRAAANGPASLWWLPRLVDLRGVDLFHAPANILPAGLAMPAVTTIHDTMWLARPDLCNPRLWGQVERRFYGHGMRRALRRSAAILTVSEASRAEIVALKPKAADQVFAAFPGVSPVFACKAVGDAAPRSRPYVLTVGQNAPYKNHATAIRAFALAFPDGTGPDLVLVQRRGPDADALRSLVRATGLGDRVQFLTPVSDDHLAALYRGAIALLHPSFCEGFGMPLAEAMASGCPVITSNLSAMPEVTGGAALLVDPNDPADIAAALRAVATDPTLANQLSDKGRERAKALDWRAFAAANLAVYRSVLAR